MIRTYSKDLNVSQRGTVYTGDIISFLSDVRDQKKVDSAHNILVIDIERHFNWNLSQRVLHTVTNTQGYFLTAQQVSELVTQDVIGKAVRNRICTQVTKQKRDKLLTFQTYHTKDNTVSDSLVLTPYSGNMIEQDELKTRANLFNAIVANLDKFARHTLAFAKHPHIATDQLSLQQLTKQWIQVAEFFNIKNLVSEQLVKEQTKPALTELSESVVNITELAKHFNLSRTTVSTILTKEKCEKIKIGNTNCYNKYQAKTILNMYLDRKSLEAYKS